MKRNNLILLVLILAIGFATVSTTLILNGTLNIGENTQDFDVYFSKALEDGVENNKLIRDDTHLEFSAYMSLKGEKYILDYDVTNGSRNYDAEITINCTESNEYLSVTNEFDTSNYLLATETRRGKLTIEVLKPYVGDNSEPTKDITITCEIVGNAVERESLGEGTPNTKVEQVCEPQTYENGVWKYTDNDCSGDLTKGDLITLDTESFYVYDIDGDNVKAISQYNVDIHSTGLQSTSAGTIEYHRGTIVGEIEGVTEIFVSNVYETSDIKSYVDAYKTKLEELNGNISEARLITIEELEALGCDSSNYICESVPSYITSIDYWTMSPLTGSDVGVWIVFSGNITGFLADSYCGARPVIEVSKSLFE